MFCDNCLKLALFPKIHGCVNCPRFSSWKEAKYCDTCSATKNICAVCGKPIKSNDLIPQQINEQIERIHPFYGGGCRTCGGRKH